MLRSGIFALALAALFTTGDGLAAWQLPDGSDPHHVAGDGSTALHDAAEAGDTDLVRALLEAGAEVDPKTRLGAYTPLHLAAAAAKPEDRRS